MPTNQSSPWDGRKPRPRPDSPATAAIKVPSAPPCDGSSGGTDRPKDISLWGGQPGSQTAPFWSCSTTLTPASLTARSVPPGSVPPGSMSVPPELRCADGPPGRPRQQIRRLNAKQLGSHVTSEAADSSTLPSQCLQHQQASSSSSSSSSRRDAGTTRRILSGKVSRRRPAVSVRPLSAERQLLVRGCPPAVFSSAGAGSKQGRGVDKRSSSQEEEEEEKEEVHITVGSVTSHISSICLSTPAPPAGSSPPAPPAGSSPPAPPAGSSPPGPPAGSSPPGPPAPPAGSSPPGPPAGSSPPGPPTWDTVTSSGHRWSDDGTQVNVVGEDESDEDLENNLSDESDCCSITAASSCTSIATPCSIEDPMSAEDVEEHPALVPSLFPLVPPTLYFSTANEKVELLPAEQRRLLKWKMSTVTPNVVKHTIARSHFKVTKKSTDWLGCWGHHMKSSGFRALAEHQKLNHFPGTFQIGRKDRLWRNLSKMQLRFGKQEFGFFPRTFVLPQDIKLLRKAWEDAGSRQKWIIKPPASARGIGIQVIHKWSQLPRKRPLLVQRYLHKPYLIGGNKFDLRIYVYVTSYDPLRVYIFSDGLVRFASCKYSSSMKTLGNKFMHLTNYSVNKKNADYQSNSDDKACQGHKWALKALWQYLSCRGVNTTLIWEKIKDIVIKTIIASEPYVNSLLKMNVRSARSCHELFGFDIMLDENLKPWILEVNISPSLHSNTALDVSIKGQMIRDLLNLAGFRIPQREELLSPCSSASSSSSSLCGSSRERSRTELSADEKVKRAFYLTQRYTEQDFLSSVLDVLTPEDVRVLSESEDELSRRGDFERIFPAASSARYLRFFECPRYLNLLLDQWEQKHWSNRTKGIDLLRTLCQRGVHLGTNDPAHMWSKCSYISRCEGQRQELLSPSRSRVLVSHHTEEESTDQDVSSACSLPTSPSPESSVCGSLAPPSPRGHAASPDAC